MRRCHVSVNTFTFSLAYCIISIKLHWIFFYPYQFSFNLSKLNGYRFQCLNENKKLM